MPDVELLFPSLYLKACDLHGRDVTVVIDTIKLDELALRGGGKKRRGVMTLKGKEKMFVLNRTNAETICKLYGRNTDNWIGKPITLYSARVAFGRDMVDAIRVREQVPQPRAPKNGNGKTQRGPAPEPPPPQDEEQDELGDDHPEPGSSG